MTFERDLAGEATERDAYRARLHADISVEECDDEEAEREARGCYAHEFEVDSFDRRQRGCYEFRSTGHD